MAVAGTAPVSVTIRSLAAGGEGVGELPDGRVVFVPFAAPQDRAAVQVVTSKRRWARGRLVRVEEPAPDRTEPA